jgi:CRP/FNR family cyclic AMP-dependent transcriptional regulator
VDDVWYLEQIDWLQELDAADWDSLRRRSTRHVYDEGETIFLPTRDPHSVYLLESGRVRIYRTSRSGDEVTFGWVAPGEVFGELPGIGEHERESYAEAQAACVAWKIPVDLFRRFVATRPALVLAVTRQMGQRMKRVESRVEDLVFRSVRSRLASVVVELAADFGSAEAGGHRIELRLSQEEMARLIGASRQSVNVAMARFRDEGIIERYDGHLVVTDLERLRAIVEAGR